MDRHPVFMGEDEIVVAVRLAGELPLEQLRLSVRLQHLDRLGVERDPAP